MTESTAEKPLYRSLAAVQSTRGYAYLAALVIIILAGVALALTFVPWQQSIAGSGKIIILSPMERPQNIESPIPAHIKQWHVKDGQDVKKGYLVAELVDLDSKFLDPEQVKRLQAQKQALTARRNAAKARQAALAMQLSSLKRSQSAALPSAGVKTHQTRDRIRVAEQAAEAARQTTITTKLNLTRLKELFEKGLRSKRDLELSELDHARALTELERALASVEIAKRDQAVAIYDQDKILADTDAALSNIVAATSSAEETIASTSGEIYKLEIDIQNAQRRKEQSLIYAPCSGRIVKLQRIGVGEMVEAGTVLAVIAPKTEDLAAELIVSDNDAPLVSIGRPVRLQFAGWPAIQFAGWPSIAVGTFGGRVAVIDGIDDGKSNYRLIIKPDVEAAAMGRDEPWPSSRFLRPGAEVNGWIMLDTVPLGFELWRQFNAFPPTIKPEELGLIKNTDVGKSDSKRKSK